MVHAFSLMDLVEQHEESKDHRPVTPVRTWSAHHLAVTALIGITGSRAVSAAEDGQIVIMELFSGAILTKIQIPEVIKALSFYDGCLFVGSQTGTIYTFDLDIYAAHQSSKLGVTLKRRKVREMTSAEDKVFDTLDNSDCYKSELQGHEKSVTALTVLHNNEDSNTLLISGDETGSIRVWDLESRGCIRVINPWSHSSRDNSKVVDNKAAKSTLHPITAILVLPTANETMKDEGGGFCGGGGGSSDKVSKSNTITNLLTPLKRFHDHISDNDPKKKWMPVPFMKPQQSKDSIVYLQPTKVMNRG